MALVICQSAVCVNQMNERYIATAMYVPDLRLTEHLEEQLLSTENPPKRNIFEIIAAHEEKLRLLKQLPAPASEQT